MSTVPASDYRGRLVALAGFSKSGKDTMCAANGWPRAAFADALKHGIRPALAELGLCLDRDKPICRDLLVEYGRLARFVKPTHWIEHLWVPNGPLACITDTRYANEAEFVQSKGGVVIYLSRKSAPAANAEEAATCARVSEMPGVVTVTNDGTIEACAVEVREVVRKHFKTSEGA